MIEKISKQLIDICISECKKEHNRTFIKKTIIDPVLMHILGEIQPFVIASIVYFISTFIMLIVLLIIILTPRQ